MMKLNNVFAFARSEIQLTRRLARYWLFTAVSYITAILIYLVNSALYGTYSSYSASVSLFNPRFLAETMGQYTLLVYTAGAVFFRD